MHLNGAINSVCVMLNKPRIRVFTRQKSFVDDNEENDLYNTWLVDNSTIFIKQIHSSSYNKSGQKNYFYDLRCN